MNAARAYAPADHEKPRAAQTAGARHRRWKLPCEPDLTSALLRQLAGGMPARDRRHETAAAYPEIEEWITFLDLEGKSARTLYAYERVTAPLLRSHPGKRLAEFTSADINDELRAIPPRSRHIS